ncbi:MAG: spore cortex-lytic enzyme [Acutalibacteraceae bacterium]
MKNKLKITITFLLCTILAFSFVTESVALSKYGSRGEEVREIQRRLKKWDYYSGSIDGIYGSETKAAVIKFQKKNGLTADGIAGKNTLAKMGIYGKSNSSSNSDLNLLAKVISAEARGESYRGQVAVGAVILNRVSHSSFPDSISGVVYQSGAFSCMYDGQINTATTDSAYKAAQDALNGWDPSGGAIYYYNPKTAKSSWIRNRPVILTIGNHVFCK